MTFLININSKQTAYGRLKLLSLGEITHGIAVRDKSRLHDTITRTLFYHTDLILANYGYFSGYLTTFMRSVEPLISF